MRHFLVYTIVSLLLAGSFSSLRAEDKKDETPETIKAWTEFHKTDDQLTDIYQKILISLGTATQREKFTEAENLWLKFRKVQGEFVAEGAADKTAYKLALAASFEESTQARIADLQKWQAAQPKK